VNDLRARLEKVSEELGAIALEIIGSGSSRHAMILGFVQGARHACQRAIQITLSKSSSTLPAVKPPSED
jgi:hypothetical protein